VPWYSRRYPEDLLPDASDLQAQATPLVEELPYVARRHTGAGRANAVSFLLYPQLRRRATDLVFSPNTQE